MKRRSLWILVLSALVLTGASAVVMADFGDDDPAQDLNIIVSGPGGSDCYCPAVWDPVVCKGADHSLHYFSNGCVAACNGFTHCARITIARP